VRRFALNSHQGFDENDCGKIGAGNEVRTRDLNLGKVAVKTVIFSNKTDSIVAV